MEEIQELVLRTKFSGYGYLTTTFAQDIDHYKAKDNERHRAIDDANVLRVISKAPLTYPLFKEICLKEPTSSVYIFTRAWLIKLLAAFCEAEQFPPQALAALAQMAVWAEKIAKVANTTLVNKQDRLLPELAKDITQKIAQLQNDGYYVVPAGILHADGFAQCFLQIRRSPNNHHLFNITLISRDAIINPMRTVEVLNDKKGVSHFCYVNVPAEKFNSELFWQALMILQIPRLYVKEVSSLPSMSELSQMNDIQALLGLLDPLRSYYQPSTSRVFHKMVDNASSMQNMWALLHDIMLPNQSSVGCSRRRLRFEFAVFNAFTQKFSGHICENASLFRQTQMALLRLRQHIFYFQQLHTLSLAECQNLFTSLDAAQAKISFDSPRLIKEALALISKRDKFKQVEFIALEMTDAPQQKPLLAAVDAKLFRQNDDFPPPDFTQTYALPLQQMPYTFAPATFLQDVGKIAEKCNFYGGQRRYVELLNWVGPLMVELPFTTHLPQMRVNEEEYYDHESPWFMLTITQREALAQDLSQIVAHYHDAMDATMNYLLEHMLVVIKLFSLLDHLAHLNVEKTKYSPSYYLVLFHDHFKKLISDDKQLRSFLRETVCAKTTKLMQEIGQYERNMQAHGSDYLSHHPIQEGDTVRRNRVHLSDYGGARYYRKLIQTRQIKNLIVTYCRIVGAFFTVYTKESELPFLSSPDRDHGYRGSNESYQTKKLYRIATLNWGKPITMDRMIAAVSQGEVNSGEKEHCNNHPLRNKNVRLTQELLVDKPGKASAVMENASAAQAVFEYKKTESEAKAFTKNEFTDIFFAFDPSTGIWQLCNIFLNQPMLFKNVNLRNALDIVLQQSEEFHNALQQDPSFKPFFQQCLQRAHAFLSSQHESLSALWIISIARKFHILTYEDALASLSAESLHRDAALRKFCQPILQEKMRDFLEKDSLNLQDIHDILVTNVCMRAAVMVESEIDSVMINRINHFLHRWQSVLATTCDGDAALRRTLLATLCKHQQLPLPIDWQGEYPRYHCEFYTINLISGEITSEYQECSQNQLPLWVLRHPDFLKIYPHFQQDTVRVQSYLQYYQFVMPEGVINRLILNNEKQDIQFVRYVEGEWWRYNAGSNFERWHGNLPYPILGSKTLVNVKKSYEIISFNEQDKPLFRIELQPDRLTVKLTDCRSKDHTGLIGKLATNEQELLVSQLWHFTRPFLIILWYQQRQLVEVELLQYGLRFAVKDNQLYCLTSPYEHYRLDVLAQHPLRKLCGACVILFSPDVRNNDVMLLPTFGTISYVPVFSLDERSGETAAKFMREAVGFATTMIIGQKHAELNDLPNPLLVFANLSNASYWQFDIISISNHLVAKTKESLPAFLDLITYIIEDLSQNCIEGLDLLPALFRQLSNMGSMRPLLLSDEACSQVRSQCRKLVEPKSPLAQTLGLKAIISLMPIFPLTFQREFAPQVVSTFLRYLSGPKNLPNVLHLSKEQKAYCLSLLSNAGIHTRGSSFALLAHPQQEISVTIQMQDLPHYRLAKPGSLADQHHVFVYQLYKQMTNPKPITLQTFRYGEATLEKYFNLLYEVVAFSALDENFKKVYTSLLIQPVGGLGLERNIVLAFLVIARSRQAGIQTVFPQFPNEILTNNPDDDLDIKKANIAKLFNFLAELDKLIEQLYQKPSNVVMPALPNPRIPHTPMRVRDQIQASPYRKTNPAQVKKLQVDPPAVQNPLSALFEKTVWPEQFLNVQLDLNSTLNHTNACVRLEAEETQAEFLWAKQNRAETQLYRVKKGGFETLAKELDKKYEFAKNKAEYWRDQINRFISQTNGPVDELALRAKAVTLVDWNTLLTLFLQHNIKDLQIHLRNRVKFNQIKPMINQYFRLEIEVRWLSLLISRCQQLKADPNDILAHQQLHEMLHRQRCFDPDAEPQLLFVEYMLGFILRPLQIELIEACLNNKDLVRQATTGSGKTSAALLAVAILKANGKNIVTVKFLDQLVASGLEHFQNVLGDFMQRMIMPFFFHSRMPIIEPEILGGTMQKISLFQRLYQQLVATREDRGVNISDRTTAPQLEAKFIALLNQVNNFPKDYELPELTLKHIYYLAKILFMLRTQGEDLYDEHDKHLAYDEEIHLRISDGVQAPNFLWKITLSAFYYLLEYPQLLLTKGLQQELSEKERTAILAQAAQKMLMDYCQQHSLEYDKLLLHRYVLGLDEAILVQLDKADAQHQDVFSLMKDLFSIYIPLTLAKKNRENFIRAADGIKTIPTLVPGKAREGAEFDNIRELYCYTILDYLELCLSRSYFDDWLTRKREQAITELAAQKLHYLHETPASKFFQTFFPAESLERLSRVDYDRLYQQVVTDRALLRKYLELILPLLELPGDRVTIDAHNQVSIVAHAIGLSATRGCTAGLHRRFDRTQLGDHHDRGQMLLRFMTRLQGRPLLLVDPSKPDLIVKTCLQQQPDLKNIIDGGSLQCSLDPQAVAQDLLTSQKRLTRVNYFTNMGELGFVGDNNAPLLQQGFNYPAALARGADAKLHPANAALLLENKRIELEDAFQHDGRLRNEQQAMSLAVAEQTGFNRPDDFINNALAIGAENNAQALFASKKQEQRDIVRNNMMFMLLQEITKFDENITRDQLEDALRYFRGFDRHGILITRRSQNYEQPGDYYRLHRKIEHAVHDPIKILVKSQQKFLGIAQQEQLQGASTELANIDYTQFDQRQLPTGVKDSDQDDVGRTVEVHVEAVAATMAQVEVLAEVEVATEPDLPDYLPDRHPSEHYSDEPFLHPYHQDLHPAFDKTLFATENFLPIGRIHYAGPAYWRKPHDRRQNRLAYVRIIRDEMRAAPEPLFYLVAISITDSHNWQDARSKYALQLDVRTNKVISCETHVDLLQLRALFENRPFVNSDQELVQIVEKLQTLYRTMVRTNTQASYKVEDLAAKIFKRNNKEMFGGILSDNQIFKIYHSNVERLVQLINANNTPAAHMDFENHITAFEQVLLNNTLINNRLPMLDLMDKMELLFLLGVITVPDYSEQQLAELVDWLHATKVKIKQPEKIDFEEQVLRPLVQMRFADGQFNGYSALELQLLRKWISTVQDPDSLEDYFIQRVLGTRPEEAAAYTENVSQLGEIFQAYSLRRLNVESK